VFSVRPVPRLYYKDQQDKTVSRESRESLEAAVRSCETDLSEVVIPGGGVEGGAPNVVSRCVAMPSLVVR
jgi:hypothetical protein